MTFRDAPPGSYVNEDGWLIVGDEAWTLDEWTEYRREWDRRRYGVRYATDAERKAARRRTWREYMRRRRARERAA